MAAPKPAKRSKDPRRPGRTARTSRSGVPSRIRAAKRNTSAEARVALMTAPDLDTARRIARILVESKVCACVNVLPGATSIYSWKGAIEEASEVLLIAKTIRTRVAELERALAKAHPYEVPELVVVGAAHVESKYLAWLVDETR